MGERVRERGQPATSSHANDGGVCGACTDNAECGTATCLADPCATANGGCRSAGVICVCHAGFMGNGAQCADVDECAMNLAGCAESATCTNTVGSSACSCSTGFGGGAAGPGFSGAQHADGVAGSAGGVSPGSPGPGGNYAGISQGARR